MCPAGVGGSEAQWVRSDRREGLGNCALPWRLKTQLSAAQMLAPTSMSDDTTGGHS